MLTVTRTSNAPYTIEIGTTDIKSIANKEKNIPREWINEKGNDVNSAMIEYLAPLIEGETNVAYKNGLPVYLPVGHLSSDPSDRKDY
jgi:6-phosphofructokinase 1